MCYPVLQKRHAHFRQATTRLRPTLPGTALLYSRHQQGSHLHIGSSTRTRSLDLLRSFHKSRSIVSYVRTDVWKRLYINYYHDAWNVKEYVDSIVQYSDHFFVPFGRAPPWDFFFFDTVFPPLLPLGPVIPRATSRALSMLSLDFCCRSAACFECRLTTPFKRLPDW